MEILIYIKAPLTKNIIDPVIALNFIKKRKNKVTVICKVDFLLEAIVIRELILTDFFCLLFIFFFSNFRFEKIIL